MHALPFVRAPGRVFPICAGRCVFAAPSGDQWQLKFTGPPWHVDDSLVRVQPNLTKRKIWAPGDYTDVTPLEGVICTDGLKVESASEAIILYTRVDLGAGHL
jgi:hypothetical protein